jgi:hypothetical protein
LLVQTAGDFSGVVWADVNLNIADNQWVTRQNNLFESRGQNFMMIYGKQSKLGRDPSFSNL